MLDEMTAVAVGFAGTILKTTNGGTTWTPQTSGVTSDLRSVAFRDANNGIAVGIGGRILRTTNGGTTWTPISGVTANLYSVAYDGTDIVAAGNNIIVRSVNDGVSWTAESPSGISGDLYALSFKGAHNGWAVGQNGKIFRYNN